MDHLLKAKKEYKSLRKLEIQDMCTEMNKACFQHDTAYGNFKDLVKRTAAVKDLRDKAFNIAKDPKYDGNQRGLTSMVYDFLIKRLQGMGCHIVINLYLKMNN